MCSVSLLHFKLIWFVAAMQVAVIILYKLSPWIDFKFGGYRVTLYNIKLQLNILTMITNLVVTINN